MKRILMFFMCASIVSLSACSDSNGGNGGGNPVTSETINAKWNVSG